MKRPDLDGIGKRAVRWEDQTLGDLEAFNDQVVELLAYARHLEEENKRLLENGAGRIRMCRQCYKPFDPAQVGQTVCQPCMESDPDYGKAYTDRPRIQP